MAWKEFFEIHGQRVFIGTQVGESSYVESVEDLYQAFKARLMDEVVVVTPVWEEQADGYYETENAEGKLKDKS